MNHRLLSREELGENRVYKFAGRVYHHWLIGTKVRITYRTIYLFRKLGQKAPGKTILFYPDKPDYSQVLYKICNVSGYAMSNSVESRSDLIIAFQDVTRRADDEVLTELAASTPVVNQYCDDISKTRVEEVFRDVFGYGTFVNPETHVGPCVMKSNENAMHDGEVVVCPTTPTGGDVVYQKLINNVVGDEVLDIRVPIIRGAIPFVYLKYRNVRSRFSNFNSRVTMDSDDSVFSADEISELTHFADRLGLDFGELDVLRDGDDGKIYIVDVNNTPCGPPNHMSRADSARAIELLTHSFNAEFFASTTERLAHRKDVR
jgi:hypothetical protein